MTLATLTDQERRDLLRDIAHVLSDNWHEIITSEQLLAAVKRDHEDAYKYRDLCR